jgi:hypothetical protein
MEARMSRRFGPLLIALMAFAPAAWADSYETPVPAPPPTVTGFPPTMPGPASPGLARVYIYRDSGSYRNLEWTAVWFNGARVGDSAPGTYFYRDLQAGTYTIKVRSEGTNPDQETTVTVAPGSTTYIKVWAIYDYARMVPVVRSPKLHFDGVQSPSAGNVFSEQVVDPVFAIPEISKLEPMS